MMHSGGDEFSDTLWQSSVSLKRWSIQVVARKAQKSVMLMISIRCRKSARCININPNPNACSDQAPKQ